MYAHAELFTVTCVYLFVVCRTCKKLHDLAVTEVCCVLRCAILHASMSHSLREIRNLTNTAKKAQSLCTNHTIVQWVINTAVASSREMKGLAWPVTYSSRSEKKVYEIYWNTPVGGYDVPGGNVAGGPIYEAQSPPLAKNSIVNYRKNTIVLSVKYTIVKLL